MRHVNYLKYLLSHKWFVFVACMRIGASPLLGIVHDLSKFKLSEWLPYARCFYAPDGSKQYREGPAFTFAWNERYVLEMVADWMGAGRAITGRWNTRAWYVANKTTIQLHPETRAQVEAILHV